MSAHPVAAADLRGGRTSGRGRAHLPRLQPAGRDRPDRRTGQGGHCRPALDHPLRKSLGIHWRRTQRAPPCAPRAGEGARPAPGSGIDARRGDGPRTGTSRNVPVPPFGPSGTPHPAVGDESHVHQEGRPHGGPAEGTVTSARDDRDCPIHRSASTAEKLRETLRSFADTGHEAFRTPDAHSTRPRSPRATRVSALRHTGHASSLQRHGTEAVAGAGATTTTVGASAPGPLSFGPVHTRVLLFAARLSQRRPDPSLRTRRSTGRNVLSSRTPPCR